MSNKTKSKQVHLHCSCEWRDEYCKSHQQFLTNEPRGKCDIRLGLSRNTECKKWKKSVVNNLCVDATSINNWNQILIS